MASPVNAVLCALLATAFWTVLGYAAASRLLPRVLALGASPVIGWALFSAVTLPVLTVIGFSVFAVVGVAALCLVIGGSSLVMRPAPAEAASAPAVPLWSYAPAAVLALVPAVAIMPKFSEVGVHLADPIFDHSKISIIDAMTRQGLPPVNPVFGEFGTVGRLAYYYLWHFSAAELALPLRASGWEADIGLTWFTAFASLTLMMGVAVWLSKKPGAAFAVVALGAGASLRGTLYALFGSFGLEPFMLAPHGLAGWLFQSAWAPQHLMSASCVVVAMLLIVHYAQRQNLAVLLMLVLIVVAGFESSAYVGGVTFAIAVLAAAPILLLEIHPARRNRIALGLASAAVLAGLLAAPFVLEQLATVAARGGGSPIGFHHYEVLGEMFPVTLRRALDWAAFWLILLPIEFPATYVAGLVALAVLPRGATAGPEKTALTVLSALAATGLGVSWLLVGTLGDNNDLAFRAILPAAMVLIAAAAAGLMQLSSHRGLIAVLALGGLVLSLPDAAGMAWRNIEGTPAADGGVFAQTPDLWAAVRRYAAPTARVADNPLFLRDLTPWPANMSWALLANRSSCFAGRELALAFAPLPAGRRETINAQFIRVFAGQAAPGDVSDMAKQYACDVVVIVPQDGAWANDPFAASPDYRLAESRDGRWRIYARVPPGTARH
jgi:hypothetical protein